MRPQEWLCLETEAPVRKIMIEQTQRIVPAAMFWTQLLGQNLPRSQKFLPRSPQETLVTIQVKSFLLLLGCQYVLSRLHLILVLALLEVSGKE